MIRQAPSAATWRSSPGHSSRLRSRRIGSISRPVPDQGVQIASHRIHAAWPSPRRHVAVGPDQHGRPGAVVTRSGRLRNVARNDVQVFAVESQRGVVQHAGQVRRGNDQDVPATAQDAVQPGPSPAGRRRAASPAGRGGRGRSGPPLGQAHHVEGLQRAGVDADRPGLQGHPVVLVDDAGADPAGQQLVARTAGPDRSLPSCHSEASPWGWGWRRSHGQKVRRGGRAVMWPPLTLPDTWIRRMTGTSGPRCARTFT